MLFVYVVVVNYYEYLLLIRKITVQCGETALLWLWDCNTSAIG